MTPRTLAAARGIDIATARTWLKHPLVRWLVALPMLPCLDALAWAAMLPSETPIAVAWHTCPNDDWLCWVASVASVNGGRQRRALFAHRHAARCDARDAYRRVIPWPVIAQALARMAAS